MSAKKEVDIASLPVCDFPAWLAGMFEVANHVSIQILQAKTLGDHSYLRSRPLLQVVDSDPSRVKKLQSVAGGSVHEHHDFHSFKWHVRGHSAAELARLMLPFSVASHEIFSDFIQWDEAQTSEEKLAIAAESKRRGLGNLSEEELAATQTAYGSLLDNPDIVAGIIDARGGVYMHKKRKISGETYHFPMLKLFSSNRPLLVALHEKFGGRLYDRETRAMKQHERKEDLLRWDVNNRDFVALMTVVESHLHLRESPTEE